MAEHDLIDAAVPHSTLVVPADAHDDGSLTIGQVAKAAGVGVETIRFYERRELLDRPRRSRSGYRLYTREAVEQIGFIKRAQSLGFTLREVRQLLGTRRDPTADCSGLHSLVKVKSAELGKRIAEMTRMKGTLDRILQQNEAETPGQGCRIIAALEHETPVR
jgi:MerR family mercuric resistance operon transcriptional regulator